MCCGETEILNYRNRQLSNTRPGTNLEVLFSCRLSGPFQSERSSYVKGETNNIDRLTHYQGNQCHQKNHHKA